MKSNDPKDAYKAIEHGLKYETWELAHVRVLYKF